MVYFNAKKKTLWFGRDPRGRHSLLFNIEPLLKEIVVSSVACAQMKVQEVPSVGLFQVVFGDSGEWREVQTYGMTNITFVSNISALKLFFFIPNSFFLSYTLHYFFV